MIFADSSFFIGLVDRKDQWHPEALEVSNRIKGQLMVSDMVIAESVTSIGHRAGGKAGKKLFDFFMDSCQVEFVDGDILRKSMATFLKFDGKLSVADSASLEIMKERGISRIISFDSDFDRVKDIQRIR